MRLSRLQEVILGYTTFGGELDFPRYIFRRGLAALGGLFALRLTLVGPQISETKQAIGVLAILFVISLILVFFFLRNTVQYAIDEEIRQLSGILIIGLTYLILSGIVVLVLYPLLNVLRPESFRYTSAEIGVGLNIASFTALLTIIANRSALKSRYPSLQTIESVSQTRRNTLWIEFRPRSTDWAISTVQKRNVQ